MKLRRRTSKNVKEGNDAPAKRAGFGKTAVLLSAFGCFALAGCSGDKTKTGPRDVPPMTAGVSQAKKDSRPQLAKKEEWKLKTGDEFYFGITWRSIYGMKITEVGKDTVKANITFPISPVRPAVNIMTLHLTFNDVELLRSQLVPLKKVMKDRATSDEAKKALEKLENMSMKDYIKQTEKGEKEKATGKRKPSAQDISAAEKTMKGLIKDKEMEGIEAAVAGLFSMTGGKWDKGIRLVVEGSNDKEFVLRVKDGKYDGKKAKLSREVTLNIEFLYEKAGLFSLPFRIESLRKGKDGRLKAKLTVDCSRNVDIEIFMSQHSSKPPQCEKR